MPHDPPATAFLSNIRSSIAPPTHPAHPAHPAEVDKSRAAPFRLATPVRASLTALLLAAAGSGAWAAPFQNGSFEAGNTPCPLITLPAGTTFTAGWQVTAGNIDWVGPPPCLGNWQASQGDNSLDLVGNQGIGGIAQTFDTVVGTVYRVTFDLAGNPGGPPRVKPLLATAAGVSRSYLFDTTGRSAADLGWTSQQFDFVATQISTTLAFTSDVQGLDGGGNAGAALDNVRVTPLPAPTSVPLDAAHWLAAVAMALAGLLLSHPGRQRQR